MNKNPVVEKLRAIADQSRAQSSAWFFKTGPGQYGEGDKFLGISVPNQRLVAKQSLTIGLDEVRELFDSSTHEHRLTAALILTYKFAKADSAQRKILYDFYLDIVLRHTTEQIAPDFLATSERKGIDAWDIVDTSAHKIMGRFLSESTDASRDILYQLAASPNLWHNRVAVLTTCWFIARDSDFEDCLQLCSGFLNHKHDLIHKACGWMLREIGKKDLSVLENFLDQNYQDMPRTMLRYAIEKLPESERQRYLSRN